MPSLQRPLPTVRFEHGTIPELGMHCITSPDIPGFHIMGKTYEEAEREALAMVSIIQGLDRSERRGRLAVVEFKAA